MLRHADDPPLFCGRRACVDELTSRVLDSLDVAAGMTIRGRSYNALSDGLTPPSPTA